MEWLLNPTIRIPPRINLGGCNKNKTTKTSVGDDVEKLEPTPLVGMNDGAGVLENSLAVSQTDKL